MIWKDDTELFSILKEQLFTAVLGDILDQLKFYNQFLSPKIKAIKEGMVMVGRAMPVLEADTGSEIISANSLDDKDFGIMFEALDSLKENDIYICTGSSYNYALWGEMMSTRAIWLKSAGCVLDGYHRDTDGILKSGFNCFSHGAYAQDQGPRGKVVDFGVPIEMDGVTISPGDIIFGDRDGVLVIPKQVETEVINKAIEKANTENKLKIAIEGGMSTVEAYAKFGVM